MGSKKKFAQWCSSQEFINKSKDDNDSTNVFGWSQLNVPEMKKKNLLHGGPSDVEPADRGDAVVGVDGGNDDRLLPLPPYRTASFYTPGKVMVGQVAADGLRRPVPIAGACESRDRTASHDVNRRKSIAQPRTRVYRLRKASLMPR